MRARIGEQRLGSVSLRVHLSLLLRSRVGGQPAERVVFASTPTNHALEL